MSHVLNAILAAQSALDWWCGCLYLRINIDMENRTPSSLPFLSHRLWRMMGSPVTAPMSSLCSFPNPTFPRSVLLHIQLFTESPYQTLHFIFPSKSDATMSSCHIPTIQMALSFWLQILKHLRNMPLEAIGPLCVAATTPPVLHILSQKFLLTSATLKRSRILANHTSNFCETVHSQWTRQHWTGEFMWPEALLLC